jgi:O-antigen/teichoic acid export membrane protein
MLQRIAVIGGWGFTLRSRLLRQMVVFGGIAHLGNIAVQLYQRLVIYILGAFAGMAQVGYYTLAMNISEKQLAVLNPIITASNYRIIGDDKKSSEALLAKVIRFSSTILLLGCLIIIPASRWIIRLLYGKAFEPAAIPLMILMPGVAIHGLSCIFALYFSGQLGKPIITMKIAFFSLIVSLPICWFLTRSFLLPGAAVSTTIIYCIAFLPLVYLFAKKSRIKPAQYFLFSLNELKQASSNIYLSLHAGKLK